MTVKQVREGRTTPVSDPRVRNIIKSRLNEQKASESFEQRAQEWAKQKSQKMIVTAFFEGLLGNKKKAKKLANELTPKETERAFKQAMDLTKEFNRAKEASPPPLSKE